jgi:hypothetical protein
MKKALISVSFAFAFLVGVSAYIFYSFSRQALRPSPQASDIAVPETTLQASATQQPRDLPSIPVPPPATDNAAQSAAEPARTLVGSTPEHIKQIEESLPRDSRIYLSPIDRNKLAPAMVETDLDGDGSPELVVVHTTKPSTSQEPTPPLSISVLSRKADTFVLTTSTELIGGVIFNVQMNGSPVPLVVSDLTREGYREIVVASGVGASLGGELHVFRFQGNSLLNISNIGGNVFGLRTSADRSVIITAESRYENKPRSYKWNGHEFVMAA